jgi:hypothetical protein
MDRVKYYSPSDWAGGYNLEKAEQIILNFGNGKEYDINDLLEFFKHNERFRELFYNTDKYTPELAEELCNLIKKNWELFVRYILQLHEWQDDTTREYLIREFKVKFQKSLTPKWENGEVVYICLGYHNKWWTF